MDKIKQYLRREMRHYKRQQRRCKREYPDWRDDEYNCLDNLFVWALTERPEDQRNPSFYTLNKAEIYYNRANKTYYLQIDAGYFDLKHSDSRKAYAQFLHEICDALKEYLYHLNGNGLELEVYNLAEIIDYGLSGDSLEEIYSKLYLLISGIDKYYN